MYITTKDKGNRVDTSEGEIIFEMIGCEKNQGGALKHSVAHVVIPSGCSSLLHYHPEAEETYCILKGEGEIVVDGRKYSVKSGDTVFISPLEKHQIFAHGTCDLEFIAVCAPAWTPECSVFL